MGRKGFLGAFEELVLLAVIRAKGAGYGMTIRREIEERAGREVAIGAVYATLDRMEDKGWVVSHLGDPDPDRRGRARRYFEIRPAGVQALESARRSRDGLWDGVDLDSAAEGGR